MSFCQVCGTELPENSKFCPKCGQALMNISDTISDFAIPENNTASIPKSNLSPQEEQLLNKLKIETPKLVGTRSVALLVWGIILGIPGFVGSMISFFVAQIPYLGAMLLLFDMGPIFMVIGFFLINGNRKKRYNRNLAKMTELQQKRGY